MNVIGEPIDECGPIGAFAFLLFRICDPSRHPSDLRCYGHPSNPFVVSCEAGTLSSDTSFPTCAETSSSLAIHREAPPFVDQSTEMEMLVTGIKVRHGVLVFPFSNLR